MVMLMWGWAILLVVVPSGAFILLPCSVDTQLLSSSTNLHSIVDAETIQSINPSTLLVDQFLSEYGASLDEGRQWAHEFGFNEGEGSFYAIFRAIRSMDSNNSAEPEEERIKLMGLTGKPFYVSQLALVEENASDNEGMTKLSDFKFHFSHLATALEEDFLDATVGSTDNRKGWQVSAVSQPTGSSFDDARMTMEQVQTALNSGTVIFNNIGAHVPRLAGLTLASTDALSLPGALNMYVTARGMRTSAPPHTDRQDVLVVQMEGAKRWRVFSPPKDGYVKPSADPFARGKGLDNLPLHTLLEGTDGRLGCEMLLDVITREGDILFIPAGFPHTTDTVDNADDTVYDASIHLTFNIDTHVWGLDYLSVRNIALRRIQSKDLLSSDTNLYVGKVNQLSNNLRSMVMDALPLDFLDQNSNPTVDSIVNHLGELCSMINESTDTNTDISLESLRQALQQIHSYASSILEIHRDMYLAAAEEGRLRKAEAAMKAHINDSNSSISVKMTPERIQRLSLFRVKQFFQQIDTVKKELDLWCTSGSASVSSTSYLTGTESALDPNWQFSTPLQVGDVCEAELGGAYFAAKVKQIVGDKDKYNVEFFDGDCANGLERHQIKLYQPPSLDKSSTNTAGLTKKELKRLQKKTEKKQVKYPVY